MKFSSCLGYVVLFVCYIVGLIYFICFLPSLSLSTGELKVRGLYIDENAILAKRFAAEPSISSKVTWNNSNYNDSLISLCTKSNLANILSCKTLSANNIHDQMIVFTIASLKNYPTSETITFVIPFIASLESTVASIVLSSISFGNSSWVSKPITIFAVPVGDDDIVGLNRDIRCRNIHLNYLSKLVLFLKNTSSGAQKLFSSSFTEVYILDLVSSHAVNSCNLRTGSIDLLCRPNVAFLPFGHLANLPNMDIWATVAQYADQSQVIPSSRSITSIKVENPSTFIDDEWLLTFLNINTQRYNTDTTLKRRFVWKRYVIPLFSRLLQILQDQYVTILFNLTDMNSSPDIIRRNLGTNFRHLMMVLWNSLGGSNGLHSFFLDQKVDSVTLQWRFAGCHRNSLDIVFEDVLVKIEQLLRLSSGLHEKLHHSHSFYLPLGKEYFITLTEYSLCVLILNLPLLILWLCSLEMKISDESSVVVKDLTGGEKCKDANSSIHSDGFACHSTDDDVVVVGGGGDGNDAGKDISHPKARFFIYYYLYWVGDKANYCPGFKMNVSSSTILKNDSQSIDNPSISVYLPCCDLPLIYHGLVGMVGQLVFLGLSYRMIQYTGWQQTFYSQLSHLSAFQYLVIMIVFLGVSRVLLTILWLLSWLPKNSLLFHLLLFKSNLQWVTLLLIITILWGLFGIVGISFLLSIFVSPLFVMAYLFCWEVLPHSMTTVIHYRDQSNDHLRRHLPLSQRIKILLFGIWSFLVVCLSSEIFFVLLVPNLLFESEKCLATTGLESLLVAPSHVWFGIIQSVTHEINYSLVLGMISLGIISLFHIHWCFLCYKLLD